MNKLFVAMLLAATAVAPVQAAEVVLTFNTGELACTAVDGGPANLPCAADNQLIGGNYGSTPQLAVSYDSAEALNSVPRTSLVFTTDEFYTSNDGQARPFSSEGAEFSSIFFTPEAGYEVSFRSVQWDKLTATSASLFGFRVLDSDDNVIFTSGLSASGTPIVANTAYYAGGLTFQFSNNGRGSIAVDDVTVDVRATAVPGAVPEPATWAMMIGGFGLVGGAMRRQRRASRMALA